MSQDYDLWKQLIPPRLLTVMIVNETNKCYRLRGGSVVGKARPLDTNVEPMEVDQPEETEEDAIDVPEKHRRNITRLVKKNNDLFAKKDKYLGHTSTVKMRIDYQGHRPLKNIPYRTLLNKRNIVDKAIDEMLEAKVIEISQSPWSFPLVVVKKKDGSDKMCVDFRTLNKIVSPVSFPLPLIVDILSLRPWRRQILRGLGREGMIFARTTWRGQQRKISLCQPPSTLPVQRDAFWVKQRACCLPRIDEYCLTRM